VKKLKNASSGLEMRRGERPTMFADTTTSDLQQMRANRKFGETPRRSFLNGEGDEGNDKTSEMKSRAAAYEGPEDETLFEGGPGKKKKRNRVPRER